MGSLRRRLGFGVKENTLDKQESEAWFWQGFITDLIKWYNGEIKEMYGTKSPDISSRQVLTNEKDSAILAWHKAHQEAKYLYDLKVSKGFFNGKKLLDIGSGPMPSATCFEGADLYCLEPLMDKYLRIGFPIHYYGNVKFIQACSENIPIQDDFFDAAISVNALDHVDDFEKTALEILRVLKPGGTLIFHLHYHRQTQNEPLELDDQRVSEAFKGVPHFRKISESTAKMGSQCDPGETYTLWTNES